MDFAEFTKIKSEQHAGLHVGSKFDEIVSTFKFQEPVNMGILNAQGKKDRLYMAKVANKHGFTIHSVIDNSTGQTWVCNVGPYVKKSRKPKTS